MQRGTLSSSVRLTREVGGHRGRWHRFGDALVARIREATARGRLSITVVANDALFAHAKPILVTTSIDVTNCGARRVAPTSTRC
jgi:hypothetical protein